MLSHGVIGRWALKGFSWTLFLPVLSLGSPAAGFSDWAGEGPEVPPPLVSRFLFACRVVFRIHSASRTPSDAGPAFVFPFGSLARGGPRMRAQPESPLSSLPSATVLCSFFSTCRQPWLARQRGCARESFPALDRSAMRHIPPPPAGAASGHDRVPCFRWRPW